MIREAGHGMATLSLLYGHPWALGWATGVLRVRASLDGVGAP